MSKELDDRNSRLPLSEQLLQFERYALISAHQEECALLQNRIKARMAQIFEECGAAGDPQLYYMKQRFSLHWKRIDELFCFIKRHE